MIDYIDPTGEITGNWRFTPNWQMIDDAIRQPSSSSTTYIWAALGYNNVVAEITFETIVVGIVSEIKLWMYGRKEARDGTYFTWINGGWQNMYLGFPENPNPPAWISRIITGAPFDQTNIDDLKWKAIANASYRSTDWTKIQHVYYEITYEEPVLGYGHDYMGVPAANIGSVNGVPTANIASIKGV